VDSPNTPLSLSLSLSLQLNTATILSRPTVRTDVRFGRIDGTGWGFPANSVGQGPDSIEIESHILFGGYRIPGGKSNQLLHQSPPAPSKHLELCPFKASLESCPHLASTCSTHRRIVEIYLLVGSLVFQTEYGSVTSTCSPSSFFAHAHVDQPPLTATIRKR
jgi:hypothetical protein